MTEPEQGDQRPPVPVDVLVEHVCDDGSDYNDGLNGWCGAVINQNGILTMVFHPDPETTDSEYGPTLVHFRRIGP